MEWLRRRQIEVEPSEQYWLHNPLNPGRACIYAGVNTKNGKIYVGQHLWDRGKRRRSVWDRRIITHKHDKKCAALHNAIAKHGFDAFEWFIIAEGEATRADVMETTMIRWCDCIAPKGYNIRTGGARGRRSAESISRQKATQKKNSGQISAMNKKVANRPEVKKRKAESLRKTLQTQEAQAKRRKTSKEVANRPEVKEAARKTLKTRMANPAEKKKVQLSVQQPHVQLKKSKTWERKRALKMATMTPEAAKKYLAKCLSSQRSAYKSGKTKVLYS